MTASPFIIDATKDNFAEIVQKSQELPVVVDFWADWCGPCKQLMPVLAKLANDYSGRFLLAKVNTDVEQELAAHFQIRGIPSVKVIKGGAIVDEFTGVVPEAQIREILDRHCEAGEAADEAGDDPMDDISRQALEVFAQGDSDGAKSIISSALEADPDLHGARTTLAQLQLATGDTDGARISLDAVPEDARDERYNAISGMFSFSSIVASAPPAAALEKRLATDPDDSEARYQLAAWLVLANRPDAALEHLLHVVSTDRKYADDAARTAMLALFNVLGSSDPLTGEYRRKLARLLN